MNKAIWENWTNLVLGIWLFITPWMFTTSLSADVTMRASWNFWIIGASIAVAAGLALQDIKPWEEWVSLALGVWMFISPWVFAYATDTNLLWNSLIAGAAVAVFSGISIPIAQRLQHQR